MCRSTRKMGSDKGKTRKMWSNTDKGQLEMWSNTDKDQIQKKDNKKDDQIQIKVN